METSWPGFENDNVIKQFLADFSPFNKEAVLIGGWLPWIYVKLYWQLKDNLPILKTYDIDIAVNESPSVFKQSIAEYLNDLDAYSKEAVFEGELIPFSYSFTGEDNINYPLDFMSHEYMDPAKIVKIAGDGLSVIPMETVDIMLNKKNWLKINFNYKEKPVSFNALNPATYFFIKGITFSDRFSQENNYKAKKDIWSLYFVLEYLPFKDFETFYNNLEKFKENDYFSVFLENLKDYFRDSSAKGPRFVAEILAPYFPEEIIKIRSFKKIDDLLKKLDE